MIAGIFIKFAYALGLRRAANSVQRRFKKEHQAPRHPLTVFDTPRELEAFIAPLFDWRKDVGRLGGIVWPLDWVSHPEVFEARLRRDLNVPMNVPLPAFLSKREWGRLKYFDGDCDDFHVWVAHSLARTKSVTRVHPLSVGYRKEDGKRGGHTVCVYKYELQWYLFNYRIQPLDDPNDAPALVAERHGDGGVDWYVYETLDFDLVATDPDGRIRP